MVLELLSKNIHDMSIEQAKFVFRYDTSVEAAILGLQAVLKQHGVPEKGFKLYGKSLRFDRFLPEVRRMQHKGFDVIGQGFDFICGSVAKGHLDFLLIQLLSKLKIPWDDWAAQFVPSKNFVMAWIMDSEYDHWQNAYDPLQYTAVGRSYAHLPMKSNGLPYPLEQKIIDTSGNPGRWVFRDGYIEAVGAMMWLGEPFWQLTGTDKCTVMKSKWLQVSNPIPSVTKVQAADKCFTTAEGASGELQQKLRALLFGSLNK